MRLAKLAALKMRHGAPRASNPLAVLSSVAVCPPRLARGTPARTRALPQQVTASWPGSVNAERLPQRILCSRLALYSRGRMAQRYQSASRFSFRWGDRKPDHLGGFQDTRITTKEKPRA